MNKKDDTPIGYDLDKAIKDMNKAISPTGKKVVEAVDHKRLEAVKEVEAYVEKDLIEPFSRKHKTGVKLIDSKMRSILLRLASKYFFYKAICAKAGIYERRLTEELSSNKVFASAFAYARHKFIALHQDLLIQYAKDKKFKDWRAEKYILTIADKEYSERKYLTDAVSNQDAKILLMIKTEQLTIASKEGAKMLKTVGITELQPEKIPLLPFDTKEVSESVKRGKKRKPTLPQTVD